MQESWYLDTLPIRPTKSWTGGLGGGSIDFTLISRQSHFDFTPNSLRFHFVFTSTSLRCHFDFTSTSLRLHFYITSNSLRCHFELASRKRGIAALCGRGKGKRGAGKRRKRKRAKRAPLFFAAFPPYNQTARTHERTN